MVTMKRMMIPLLGVCAFLALAGGAARAGSDFDPQTGVITNGRWNNGVPLGGIGAGKFDLLPDGGFANFTINHNWDRPTGTLKGNFAAIYTSDGRTRQAKLLRLRGGDEYKNVENIAGTRYLGKFPTATLNYADPALPVDVELFAYSPLVPNDVKDSALPVAMLSFTVKNRTARTVDASVLLSWQNILGYGGYGDAERTHWESTQGNTQKWTETRKLKGLLYTTTQRYDGQRQNTVGEYFVGVSKRQRKTSACAVWDAGGGEVPFWKNFAQNGRLDCDAAGCCPTGNASSPAFRPAAALAAALRLKPGQEQRVEFVVAWFMPHFITIFGDKELIPSDKWSDSEKNVMDPFDDNPATNWNTDRPQRPGDTFTMDFGAKRTIARMVFESKDRPWDYPRHFRVEVSDDGKAWRAVFERNEKETEPAVKGGVLAVNMPAVQTRWMRLVQLSDGWPGAWTMNELYLYGDEAGKTPRIKPARAMGRTRKYDWVVTKVKEREDVSQYYANFFSGAAPVADYFFRNSPRLLAGTLEWQDLLWQSNLPFWLKLKLNNCAFPLVCNTIFTKDGRFSNLESPVDMAGCLGTMDQRLASHAPYTLLFPELDRSELELFTKCQKLIDINIDDKQIKYDGQIPHFVGCIHERIGNPNVIGGVTLWPDLTCSWVMQSLKEYRWSGDRAFLDRQWPQVQKGMQWLVTRDTDGDGIPEGGSTYDYEAHRGGAFIYTASVYLGALRAAAEMARVEGDMKTQKEYESRFARVRDNVMKNLWNGQFFIKRFEPKTGEKNPDCFIAQMAGDWMSELSGLGDLFPEAVRRSAVGEVLARNVLSFYPVPPMETTPDGRSAVDPCYILQHEPFIGMQAINAGYVDDGIEVSKRVFDVAWLYNRTPWNQRLWVDTPTGLDKWGGSYMTSGSTWNIMHALCGASLDLPGQTLTLSPRLGSATSEWHLPLFFPRFWAWVDYAPRRRQLQLRVIKTFGEGPMTISRVVGDPSQPALELERKFKVKKGAVLDLSSSMDQLIKYTRLEKAQPAFAKRVARIPNPIMIGD